MPSENVHVSETDLREAVQRWVGAGIVTPEQAESIAKFEAAGATRAAPAPTAPRRLSTVAELVTYLGIVLVLASGSLAVNRLWHGMAVGARAGVGVAVALLGFFGGYAVTRLRDEGATRLGWFLWLCGTGGVAMTSAVLVDRIGKQNVGWTLLVTGLAVFVVSVALWRNRERPLQFITSVGGLCLSVGGLVTLTHWHPNTTAVGLLVWAASIALALAGIKFVHPGLVAILVGQMGVFFGAMTMTGSSQMLGFTLGAVGAAAGVALGLRMGATPVTGLGVLTFFIFLVRLLVTYLHGPAGLLAAFVIGVALVAVVIYRATRPKTPGAAGTAPHHRFTLHH